jgi:hypothetical protein
MLAAALSLAAACASASRSYDDLGPIAGSTGSLQPRIASASTTSRDIILSFTTPQRSYVSVLQVRTQSSVSILGTAPTGSPTALQALDPGTHKLALVRSPTFVGANVRRTARALNSEDPGLAPTETRYPIREYTLVVMTTTPLSLVDLQESLASVDLTGPEDVVLQRVAEAVGAHSLGAWGASAARLAQQSAPF